MPVIEGGPCARRRWVPAVIFACAAIAFAAAARAEAPAAIVEDIESRSAGVEFMDYLPTGKVVKLSAGDRLVVGYMRSCWREVIIGGTVTIGADQSKVDAGKVDRTRVKCNGGSMHLSQEQAEKSGALSFRQAPKSQKTAPANASQRTIHALSPIIELRQPGKMTIERVDKSGERHDIEASPAKLMRGTFVDLARDGVRLAAGGLYRVRMGPEEAVFRIAPDAGAGDVPVIARLVRLAP